MDIHTRGKIVVQNFHRSNFDVVEFLIELERTKAYNELRHPGAVTYAVKELDLTYNVARGLVRIARKSIELPVLRLALKEKRVTVLKCEKIAAKLTSENVSEVIGHLEKHSAEKTLEWLGRNEEEKMLLKIALRIIDKLRHAQSLRKDKVDLEAMIEISIDRYIDQNDPVKKAERDKERKAKQRKNPARYPARRERVSIRQLLSTHLTTETKDSACITTRTKADAGAKPSSTSITSLKS